jgi:hypothetical protein
LGCFQSLAIVSNASINVEVEVALLKMNILTL